VFAREPRTLRQFGKQLGEFGAGDRAVMTVGAWRLARRQQRDGTSAFASEFGEQTEVVVLGNTDAARDAGAHLAIGQKVREEGARGEAFVPGIAQRQRVRERRAAPVGTVAK